ncbi:helix-turn-helix domain-containing protein [Paenibacillus senegalensis]|uniref:helix-turn-helix domain-containing protein n=1 Tax=Paenibacillus senegalensis TaxID=1465766 RepID=UPI0002891A91|nr:AraC family transcriptional regulator [Paenibacillus senegalensis]
MPGRYYEEIHASIAYIHKHLYEPLTLAELARHAAYSPYHFTRIFKEQIGISPQYYISSLRLQRAKDLLLGTGLSIRDISLEVGQQSLGTFTTRFTEKVGMTPSEFRHSSDKAVQSLRSLHHLNEWGLSGSLSSESSSGRYSVVEGNITAELPFQGVILIGLFAKPIPEGLPLYGTLLSSPGKFRFLHVKPGTYYLMATSVAWSSSTLEVLLPYSTLRARSLEPIVVNKGEIVPSQEIKLHPPRLDDPPILISLPVLMNQYLNRVRTIHLQSR